MHEHLDGRRNPEMSMLLPEVTTQEIARRYDEVFRQTGLADPSSGGTQPRYEVDGGVRLAGGQLGRHVSIVDDQRSDTVVSTLPPPYSEY